MNYYSTLLFNKSIYSAVHQECIFLRMSILLTVRIPSTSLVNLEKILHPLFLQPFFVTMHCNIFFRWWVIFIVVHWTQLLINVSMISLFSPNTTLTLTIQYIHPFLHALTSLLPHLGLCNYSDWLITTSSPSSSLFSLYFIWAYVTIRIGSSLPYRHHHRYFRFTLSGPM